MLEFQFFPQQMRIGLGHLFIFPSPERLAITINTDDPEVFDTIGAIAEQIYQKLPHTPIKAIGHNFSFILDKAESFKDGVCFEAGNNIASSINLALPDADTQLIKNNLQSSFKISDQSYILNVSQYYSGKPDEDSVSFNFHYVTDDYDQERYVKTLLAFSKNHEQAKKFKDQVLKGGT